MDCDPLAASEEKNPAVLGKIGKVIEPCPLTRFSAGCRSSTLARAILGTLKVE